MKVRRQRGGGRIGCGVMVKYLLGVMTTVCVNGVIPVEISIVVFEIFVSQTWSYVVTITSFTCPHSLVRW